jgi:hypothetical protein
VWVRACFVHPFYSPSAAGGARGRCPSVRLALLFADDDDDDDAAVHRRPALAKGGIGGGDGQEVCLHDRS